MKILKDIWNYLFCIHEDEVIDSETFITDHGMAFCVHTLKCKKCGIIRKVRI